MPLEIIFSVCSAARRYTQVFYICTRFGCKQGTQQKCISPQLYCIIIPPLLSSRNLTVCSDLSSRSSLAPKYRGPTSFLFFSRLHHSTIMNGSPIPSAPSASPQHNGVHLMSVEGKRILCTADVRGMQVGYARRNVTSPLSKLRAHFDIYRQHLATQPTRTRNARRLYYTHRRLWLLR